MPTSEQKAGAPSKAEHNRLDESTFIRGRLFGSSRSPFAQYRELVFHTFTWPKFFRYELLQMFVAPVPGALGFALRKLFFGSLFRHAGKGLLFGSNIILRHADRITLGDGVVLDRDCIVDARGAGDAGIVIGDRVIVNRGAAIQAKVGHIEIGADCNIGSQVDIVSQGPIIIEENVSIAGKAMIAGGRYVVALDEAQPGVKKRFTSGAIRIGRNCRIGMGAIIQDGVTLGENVVVAAGAVVFESVPADTVVWGNPARPVRTRTATDEPHVDKPARTGTAADREVRRKVCEYLENDVFIEFGPEGFSTTDSLIDSGILDSLALVRLLLWIEEKFDVDMDFQSLDPSEIDSVEKMVARITERN